jgi:hypothetical protein
MRLLLAALALTACTPPPAPTPPPNRACNAAAAQGLIGRQGGPALAQVAQRLSRARTVRFLRPGQMVTMEYRADRLNIRLDTQEKVLAITCG